MVEVNGAYKHGRYANFSVEKFAGNVQQKGLCPTKRPNAGWTNTADHIDLDVTHVNQKAETRSTKLNTKAL